MGDICKENKKVDIKVNVKVDTFLEERFKS